MCRAFLVQEGTIEVLAHAITAPEADERICGSGDPPAARVITMADGGIASAAASPRGVAIGMTQQYLAGELSVLLGRVQAVTTTETAGREAWSLRVAAEQGPIQGLGWVTVRALALIDRLCWDSLSQGDVEAFNRQAAAAAALREFGVCSCLLRDT
jgi:hypothetical protein